MLGLPAARIADLDRARAIVLLGPDLKEELPVLHLRVRRAAVELGVPLIEIAPGATGLTREASAVLRHAPGEAHTVAEQLARALAGQGTASGSGSIEKALTALDGRDGDLVVVLGRPSLAESPASVVRAAAALAGVPGTRFLSALRRGNVRGALDLGLVPGFLPGRVTLDGGRDHFTAAWGRVPAERGRDAAGILAAAAGGGVEALVLLGADVLADYPDRIAARAGLDGVGFVISVGAFGDDASSRADVFLPTSVWAERNGTVTNLEGRVQRVSRLVTPDGVVMDDWRIAAELATRSATRLGFDRVGDVTDEIAAGRTPRTRARPTRCCGRARDGAMLPIAQFPDELVPVAGSGGGGPSWEPIAPGSLDEDGSDQTPPEPVDDTSRVARGPPSARRLRLGPRRGVAATVACRRAVCASWSPAASTTPGASLRTAPRSPRSRAVPRSSCTRATSSDSASPRSVIARITSALCVRSRSR